MVSTNLLENLETKTDTWLQKVKDSKKSWLWVSLAIAVAWAVGFWNGDLWIWTFLLFGV